jgi:flagellar motor protein MotB
MPKSKLIRVVPDLAKVLSNMTAEEQEKFYTNTINLEENLLDLDQHRIAVKSMAADNSSLRRELSELKELLKKESEGNERLKFQLNSVMNALRKENEKSAQNTQIVDAELEGGAKIRISVPKPPTKIKLDEHQPERLDTLRHRLSEFK